MYFDDRTSNQPKRGRPLDLALLPQATPLLGRDREMARASSWLADERNTEALVLCGEPGIGKTTLAAALVARMHGDGRFCEGVVVVDCHGVVDGTTIIRHALAAFDVHRRTLHSVDVADLKLASERLLKGIDAIIVLLDVESPQLLDAVVAAIGGMGPRILATLGMSAPAVPLVSCHFIELDPLSADNAKKLAEAILHTGGLSDDDISASLAGISQTLREGNALAVRLAASGYLSLCGAKVEPSDINATVEIPVLANIAAVVSGPLERVFRACWSGLPQQTRQLFFSLGALNGPWFRWGTATAIGSALRLALPDEQLSLLVESALLQVGCLYEGEERILRIHPSLRDLVRVNFAALSGEIRRTSYEAAASALIAILSDSGDGPGAVELAHFPSIIEWAYRSKHDELLISLCATLAPWWYDRWQFERGLMYLPWGLAAARAMADMNVRQDEVLVAASLAHNYGLLLRHVGNHRAAGEVFRTELTLRRLTGDRSGEADTLLWIGNIALRQAELSEALEYYNQALAIYGDLGNRAGVGTALRYLGRIAQRQGYLDEAEDYYNSSLPIAEQAANLPSQIWIYSYLASIFQERGRLEMAEASYRRALHISRASGDWQGEGLVQSFRCDLALDRDQVDDAENLGWESLHLSRLAADRPTGAYTLLSLARVAMRRNELRRARALARESLTAMQEMCDRAGEVAALRVLGTEE